MFFVVPAQISFLLIARGFTSTAVLGIGGTIANASIAVGSYVFHRLARWPISRLLVLTFAPFAGGFFIIATLADVNGTIAGSFLAAMASGMVLPLPGTWILSRVPFEQSGRVTGGYMGSFFLGNFLSPIVFGAMAKVTGGPFPAIERFSAICAAVAVAALFLTLFKLGPVESVHAIRLSQGFIG